MQLFDESYVGRKDRCFLVLVVTQNTTYRGCAAERRQKTASFASFHILHECQHPGVHGDPAVGLRRGLPLCLAAASRLSHSSPLPPSVMAGMQPGASLWVGVAARQLSRRGCFAPFPICCGHARWVLVSP